jgi:quercetin dioxygenase-like cupin family protein
MNTTDHNAEPTATATAGAPTFVASHLLPDSFKTVGLRRNAIYRDLGFETGSNGRVQAHVIRFMAEPTEDSAKRHYHALDFQIAFVLKGWIKLDIEGQGLVMLQAGSTMMLPPGTPHTVLGYEHGTEILEINSPAVFDTVNV